jgi:hypothetical protein
MEGASSSLSTEAISISSLSIEATKIRVERKWKIYVCGLIVILFCCADKRPGKHLLSTALYDRLLLTSAISE